MEHDDRLERLQAENEVLRDRLLRLCEASLRINESLDFETVLQVALDAARSLTDARYGVITLLDSNGQTKNFLASGLTPEEADQLWNLPEGVKLLEILETVREPLRVRDFRSHVRSLGLPEFRPPMQAGPDMSFLAVKIRHGDESVGNFFLAEKYDGAGFTQEDEEVLAMFAAQTALVITNARTLRDERRARADLETLIEMSPVGVVVFDVVTGEPVSFNREAARIMACLLDPDQAPEELLRVVTVSRGDGREFSLSELSMAPALSEGETLHAEEVTVHIPDGRSVTTLMNATPIRSAAGEVESLVITVQDLTPLEEMERMRAEFLGIVSHELRVPLSSIKGSATTLSTSGSSLDPAELDLFFQIIEQQADHMSDLISDLLDMARIDSGELLVYPEPSDAAVLVDQARNTFLSGGGRDNIQIDIEPDLPPVMADPRRIAQVLGNLLSNAARNSPQFSPIRVTAAGEGAYIALSVADSGQGLPAALLPQLFRKFARIDGDERAGGFSGSGLGLAICKGIVEAHGGRIRAESEGPGQGASFTFTIPAVSDALPAGAGPAVETGANVFQPGRAMTRILAVDDDPQTLRHVRDALSAAGYQPIVTGDPEQVKQLMADEQPQLVLLDLMLPGTDGIELMERVPELAGVPVIFLSAYGRSQTIARALRAGAADYVVKPFSSTELIARIEAAMRRWMAGAWALPLGSYQLGELTIHYNERRVFLDGEPVPLTDTEYRVLAELSASGGRVLTHQQLLRRVWHSEHAGGGPLRTVVKNLRRKLGDPADRPRYVFTEPRVGYRMPAGDVPEDAGP